MAVIHQDPGSLSDVVDRLLFWLIALSGAAFIVVLGIAAYWDPTIVWLHVFQAVPYLAVISLAARRNRWGYLLGIAIAAFWIYIGAFVSNFVESGFQNLAISIRHGVLTRPDQLIAVLAATSQLVLMFACLGAFTRLATRSTTDWIRFFISLVFAVGYLIACFALFQPRYLAMVPRLLHPHGW